MNDPLWTLLQLSDSAFPTGGFAHSNGLEAAYQQGELGEDGLGSWLDQTLWQAGFAGLPFLGAAFDDPGALARADRLNDNFLSNPVANRASRSVGRCLVAAFAAAFPEPRLEVWLEAEGLFLHHAPALGAACAAIGVARGDAQRLFLHGALRGGLSAAVRLGAAGPLEAQRLQAERAPTLSAVLSRCSDIPPEDAAQTAPLHELFQMTQDRLYSRLFQS